MPFEPPDLVRPIVVAQSRQGGGYMSAVVVVPELM
jgi:hypothetical protein